jgi:hypothetical protein
MTDAEESKLFDPSGQKPVWETGKTEKYRVLV